MAISFWKAFFLLVRLIMRKCILVITSDTNVGLTFLVGLTTFLTVLLSVTLFFGYISPLLQTNVSLELPALHSQYLSECMIAEHSHYFNRTESTLSTICTQLGPHSGSTWFSNTTDLDSKPTPSWLEVEHFALISGVRTGIWKPRRSACLYPCSVAIIVAYRQREPQLRHFLRHIHNFLQNQKIRYGIFVVEQAAGTRFNRGALFNIGFLEVQRTNPVGFCCFVFHDVDLLPLDYRNLYQCGAAPRHLSAAVNTLDFKLPYYNIFGGAVSISAEQFRQVNGFSNIFYGWGGEDDDFANRLFSRQIGFRRYPIQIGRYVMLEHLKYKENAPNDLRFALLFTGPSRQEHDGLNTLHYHRLVHHEFDRRTSAQWFHVQLPEHDILKFWGLPSTDGGILQSFFIRLRGRVIALQWLFARRPFFFLLTLFHIVSLCGCYALLLRHRPRFPFQSCL